MGGISHWLFMFCDWIRSGLARRQGPDLRMSPMDRTSRKVSWLLFFFLWLPLIAFLLLLVWKTEWFF